MKYKIENTNYNTRYKIQYKQKINLACNALRKHITGS